MLCSIALISTSCAGISQYTHPPFQKIFSIDTAVTQQILEVVASGKNTFEATVTAWTYTGNTWHKAFGPWPAVIGRNGLAPSGEKREGDGRTPSGIYAIGTAFGAAEKFDTGLAYQQTTDDDIWIDDSASIQYNRWVKLPTDATSYEKMRRDDGLYDLGAVIEYNTDPVAPGYGSAIFIHIWRDNGQKPTAGCVALERKHLQDLLKWLKKTHSPAILIQYNHI